MLTLAARTVCFSTSRGSPIYVRHELLHFTHFSTMFSTTLLHWDAVAYANTLPAHLDCSLSLVDLQTSRKQTPPTGKYPALQLRARERISSAEPSDAALWSSMNYVIQWNTSTGHQRGRLWTFTARKKHPLFIKSLAPTAHAQM